MGWGVCFALDPKTGRVYCLDGCKWRASASDYAEYPPWPSARQSVLVYFEDEAHRELDMIRDECPGTAIALAAACDEHIGTALSRYTRLSNEEKQQMHDDEMARLTQAVENAQAELKPALEEYTMKKLYLDDFKKNGLRSRKRKARTRADELQEEMYPLQLELDMERAALRVDELRKTLASATRDLKLERQFFLDM